MPWVGHFRQLGILVCHSNMPPPGKLPVGVLDFFSGGPVQPKSGDNFPGGMGSWPPSLFQRCGLPTTSRAWEGVWAHLQFRDPGAFLRTEGTRGGGSSLAASEDPVPWPVGSLSSPYQPPFKEGIFKGRKEDGGWFVQSKASVRRIPSGGGVVQKDPGQRKGVV